ncbi:MAG: T9SS type A sorting domain-containing protein [Lentimicrobiaceae bacterium]|nr:T9SS type A sorting domain-containing protein [Lentimicrobiaceae bacterium]
MNRFSIFSCTFKILFIFTCSLNALFAQPAYYKLGFVRNQEVEVKKNNHALLYPWAGGINSVYFSQIDLNLDGVSDFIAFEKHGNRILPFLNKGSNSNPQFVYVPEYKHRFPELHDWVILRDFNNDGKMDIFTYGLGSIRVFENVSNEELAFKLTVDPILSYYYENEANIFAAPDDYLGIADITGSGRLDILNFMVLGKFVHFYKNISQNNEFFNYTLADECWGKFSEEADNNEITLFTYCDSKEKNDNPRHVGSSIFIHDFNADGLSDIIIGDVDFSGLKLLINGGTKEEALMVLQTDDFPNAQHPVNMYSMPAVSAMNFWGENNPDLFVSPSDPSLTKSEDLLSVWRYHYNEDINDYVLETKSYLQEEMIDVGSGAIPTLFDWNGDGLLDLFVANYGSFDSATHQHGVLKSCYSSSIAYYKNIGTKSSPKFEWITSDFGNLKSSGSLALYPTFADLTGDGKIDLLCGKSDGTLLFFENTASMGDLPQFKPVVTNYQNIKVDAFSAPQLFDMDNDGSLDLVLGNRRGILSYYKNTGTTNNPNFQLITSNLGNVDVRDPDLSYFGYSTPHFFRYNHETMLLCGSEQGNLFLFSNIDNNLSGTFTCLEKITETIQNKAHRMNEGIRIAAAVADLNSDNKPDIIVGNWCGGISFFNGSEPPEVKIVEPKTQNFIVYPNPTTGELRIANYELRITNYELGIANYEFETGTLSEVEVEIFDIYGRKLSSHSSPLTSHSSSLINISHLPAGVYLLRIGGQMVKLIKI